VIPVEEVGTDRHRLDMWTAASAERYNRFADGYAWDFSAFRKTNGYVAYRSTASGCVRHLHNGSVPALGELLEPVDRRRQTFYRGYDVYDPARVGFVSEGPQRSAPACCTTRRPGSNNAGHLYGVGLSADQKRALIEYSRLCSAGVPSARGAGCNCPAP
jgi:hypothetical protein